MEKGFNSDIVVDGKSVHIQTEDWGFERAHIVTRIYVRGAVVRTIKTPYEKVLPKGFESDVELLRFSLREQHYKILDLCVSGKHALESLEF